MGQGLDEPIGVHYDVDLGRELTAEELLSEEPMGENATAAVRSWRVVRARDR